MRRAALQRARETDILVVPGWSPAVKRAGTGPLPDPLHSRASLLPLKNHREEAIHAVNVGQRAEMTIRVEQGGRFGAGGEMPRKRRCSRYPPVGALLAAPPHG